VREATRLATLIAPRLYLDEVGAASATDEQIGHALAYGVQTDDRTPGRAQGCRDFALV
jgi:hypothetical protein